MDAAPTVSLTSQRFVALDVLRGAAALMVVWQHYDELLWQRSWNDLLHAPPSTYLAVDFFFMLSGVVLAHAFFDREQFGLRRFIVSRFARLWPLHLSMLVVMITMTLIFEQSLSERAVLLQVFLMHSVGIGNYNYTFNMPTWSLSVEVVLNAVVAVLFVTVRNRLAQAAALAAFSVTAFVITAAVFGQMRLIDEMFLGILNSGVLRGLITFPAGVLVYRLYQARAQWLQARIDRLPVLQPLALVLFVAQFFLPIASWVSFLSIPMMTVTILLLMPRSRFVQGGLSRLAMLGTLSYSIYLVHFPVLSLFNWLHGPAYSYVKTLAALMIVTLVAAWFAWRLVERPAYRFLTSRFAQRDQPPSPPAQASPLSS
jgi:peptidoglycan/LPS O-acetylase OafA/YrhL